MELNALAKMERRVKERRGLSGHGSWLLARALEVQVQICLQATNMLAGKPPLSFLPSYNTAVVWPEAGAGSWISNSQYLLDSLLILPLLETYLTGHTDLWYGTL